jgi:hypothetical protein
VNGEATRDRPVETVAGLMSAFAIAIGLIAIAYKPARLAPAAFIVALVAVGIGGRHQRLAAIAVAAAAIGWLLGMTIAVATERSIF